MPRVSDLVRAAGWRQGSIARPADTRALLIASVDRVPEPGESIVRLVAVTQDCDLVQEPGIEPFVEIARRRLCCRRADVRFAYLIGPSDLNRVCGLESGRPGTHS